MPARKRSASSSLSPPAEDVKPHPTPKRTPSRKGPATPASRRSTRTRSVKKEENDSGDEALIASTPVTPPSKRSRRAAKSEDGKNESLKSEDEEKPKPSPSPSKSTLAKKLKQLESYLQTPFPDWTAPTPQQCREVQEALSRVHGVPRRPEKLLDRPGSAAGCGAVPDVLDALIRTILSQNTTSKNSTTAKNAMDNKYGRANHIAVHRTTVEDLAETIQHGGLANVKAKVIKKVLAAIVEKKIQSGQIKDESELSQIDLDYLHDMEDFDAMKELVSFDGVGPKTASCVLLFCLGRNSFAVDTHVFRITKALGWTPPKANRETAFQHLDVRIPGENKYPLHSLFVRHGRSCRLCSANGNITEQEVDSEKCPIKSLLKQQRKSKKGKAEFTGSDSEDGDAGIQMPGQIADAEEEKNKAPAGVPDEEAAKQEEKEIIWENFGENKDGKMHGL